MERDCEDRYGDMSKDFLDYLRERGTCRDCAVFLSGVCHNSEIPWGLLCDGSAPACKCEWWEPDSKWADGLRRSYEMDCEEAASAREHQLAVAAHKGFEVAA